MTEHANPRIRDSVLVFSREQRLQFFCTMELRVKEFDVPVFVPELIQLMDGTRSIEELTEALQTCTPATVEDVAGVVEVLRLEMLLDRARPSLDDETRYSRQGLLFEEFIASFPHLPESAYELQERLARSRVVIVGMGGAGSWVLQSLVAAGVGNFDIVDPDVIALSNLNRQILFTSDDIGAHKVSVAAARARELNDAAIVRAHRKRVAEVADLDSLLEEADLIINCADEPSVMVASDIVATAAYARRLPHIVGGAYGGNLGIPGSSVVPGSTVCWDCIRAETSNDHGRQDMVAIKGRTRQGGSVAPVAGLVGNFVAWEALKILLNLPLSLANKVRELDLMTLDWRVREVSGRGHCAQCGSLNVDEISKGAAK